MSKSFNDHVLFGADEEVVERLAVEEALDVAPADSEATEETEAGAVVVIGAEVVSAEEIALEFICVAAAVLAGAAVVTVCFAAILEPVVGFTPSCFATLEAVPALKRRSTALEVAMFLLAAVDSGFAAVVAGFNPMVAPASFSLLP